ncbi:TetR/AcrR family transcriptional regulator C-terminal domain-containing protein [Leifsonia sp. SIMBA_070]|uniref:TetR/AcrR family transcriptional regulator C-terminal domain-containing protein n=1 Tax=Leifsonia sp. SIMBA_070 TaxID=3085810 RepID=UPI00397C69CF
MPDPQLAAQQFAGMLLWIPSNQTMFAGATRPVRRGDLKPLVDATIDAFVRSYSPAG